MRWEDLFIEKYRTITNVLGTIIVAWITSAIVGHFIGLFFPSPVSAGLQQGFSSYEEEQLLLATSPAEHTISFYQPICERNIFDSLHRTPCNEEVVTKDFGEPENSEPIKSDLQVELIGTMVFSDPRFSFATIAPKGTKDSKSYYNGDLILEEGKVYEIQRNRVFFVRNGHREFIEVDRLPNIFSGPSSTRETSSEAGIKKMGDKTIMSRPKVDSFLQNMNKVLQDSRMVPNFQDGVVNGFKIFAIRQGSVFDQLGLRNGDVVQEINGVKIDSMEKALPMLELLKNESNIGIGISRGGAKKNLSIEIQ